MVTGGRTLRIAHYAPKLWAPGGISNYVRRLGSAQAKSGHDVLYLSQKDDAHNNQNGYALIEGDSDLISTCESEEVDILHLHKSISVSPKDIPVVRTMHGHQGGCPSGTRFLKRSASPCDRAYSVTGCLWGHAVDRCGSMRPGQLMSNFRRIRQELDLCSKIKTVTVSDFLRDQMIRAGCSPDKLVTLHSPAPAVDSNYHPVPRDNAPRFVYLGRLVPQKGADWLIRAMGVVKEDVRLDIAGDGPMLDTLKALVQRRGFSDQVTFHGWLDEEQVAQLVTSARGVVFPSLWHEPAGLITLEAAAHGRAVIASDVGGIPEYARPECSILVEVNNSRELASAIDKLATNPDEAERLGRIARETVQAHFSMKDFVRRMDNIYRAVIRDLRSPKAHS